MNLLQRIEKLESSRKEMDGRNSPMARLEGIFEAAVKKGACEHEAFDAMQREIEAMTDEELNAALAESGEEPCDVAEVSDEELERIILEGERA